MEIFYEISSNKPINHRLSCTLHDCSCRFQNFIWVSKRLKLIYFDIPKCGSRSIKKTLDIGMTPLQFATAYLIHVQRHCSEQTNTSLAITTMAGGFGSYMEQDTFRSAYQLAASNLSEGKLCSDPGGKFEFMHFFGSPEQAIDLFPGYRKFIVLRSPIDRLLSTWNMFYNSSGSRLRARVSQCNSAAKERKSFRQFVENIETYPNHHFDSIGNFVSFKTIIEGKLDVVPFENLGLYWEVLCKEDHVPMLENINVAKNYLAPDIEKSELLKNERLLSYYSEDYELMKLTS